MATGRGLACYHGDVCRYGEPEVSGGGGSCYGVLRQTGIIMCTVEMTSLYFQFHYVSGDSSVTSGCGPGSVLPLPAESGVG